MKCQKSRSLLFRHFFTIKFYVKAVEKKNQGQAFIFYTYSEPRLPLSTLQHCTTLHCEFKSLNNKKPVWWFTEQHKLLSYHYFRDPSCIHMLHHFVIRRLFCTKKVP